MRTNNSFTRYGFCLLWVCSFAAIGFTQDGAVADDPQNEVVREADLNSQIQPISRLIQQNVVTNNGEEIGAVHDLVFDAATGNLVYAILSTGGFFGLNDTYHAVPFSLLELAEGNENPRVNVNSETLKEAPKYTETPEERLHGAAVDESIFTYYNVEVVSASHAVSWIHISEKAVVNEAEEEIGSIEDLLYSEPQDRVKFVTIGTSWGTELEKDRVIIPLRNIQLNVDENENPHKVLIPYEKFKNVPSAYDEEGNLIKTVNEPGWQEKFLSYFDFSSDEPESSTVAKLTSNTVMGMQVVNSKGEEIGKINDIHFDNEMSKITHLTISVGGFLGIADKEFHIEREKFTLNDSMEVLMLNMSNESFLEMNTQ